MNTHKEIAKALLKIGAVGFKPQAPITFKSGIKAPVYIDNRRFPFFPAEWQQVILGFEQLLSQQKIQYQVIAGIETAGIPHSAALGFSLKQPSIFVRKAVKDHGTKKRVEGGTVEGMKVLLIEDHITTGMSSLSGVEAIRSEGGEVSDCLAITSYAFAEAEAAFKDAGVLLHTLTTFQVILAEAVAESRLTITEKESVEDWLADPHGWAARHGF